MGNEAEDYAPNKEKMKVKVTQSCLTLCDPMDYSPWNSPGQNTGVGSHSLLLGDLPNPGIKPRSPTLQLSHHGSPPNLETRQNLRRTKYSGDKQLIQ